MRKVFSFIIFMTVVTGFCAAQNINNDAQRLIGTWISEQDIYGSLTFIFYENGTGVMSISAEGETDSENIFWGVSTSGELIYFTEPHFPIDEIYLDFYKYFLSPDGRRLIYLGIVFQKR